MANTYTYEIGENLYINLTNRCSNRCGFCVRSSGGDFCGHDLWLDREPAAAEVLSRIPDPRRYNEIVFCGYGEPTYRAEALLEIAGELKKRGARLRLNTNGQAELILGRDISKELAGCIDTVSISLNAVTAEKYQQLCLSEFGEKAFDFLQDFARKCLRAGANVVFSIVDVLPESDIQKAREIAESCGAKLRIRELIV